MTAFGIRVRSPEEAASAIAMGAEFLEFVPAAEPRGGSSAPEIEALLAKVADRVPVWIRGRERLADAWEAGTIWAHLSGASGTYAVLAGERDLAGRVGEVAAAGFSGVLVDTEAGERLFRVHGFADLARAVTAARGRGLAVAVAGGLEAPDIPRLLPLAPDALVFDAAARTDAAAALDTARIDEIRSAMARKSGAAGGGEAAAGSAVPPDVVFLHDYVVAMPIGAYGDERGAPQKVRFDVDAAVAPAEPGSHGPDMRGMAAVYSYDRISDAIDAIAAGPHVDLVETVAERLAGAVLADRRVQSVKVRVEKLETGRGRVGVEIVRPRAQEG